MTAKEWGKSMLLRADAVGAGDLVKLRGRWRCVIERREIFGGFCFIFSSRTIFECGWYDGLRARLWKGAR